MTSNAQRHKFLANTVGKSANEVLVVSECKSATKDNVGQNASLIDEHFSLRDSTEASFFRGSDSFKFQCLPILHKEINRRFVFDVAKQFNPDLIIVYGSYIVREPLLSLLPYGKIINIHLGLSPFYRGSGTNFWPFVNNELEYVGSTLLYIDKGIDTGDIVSHIRPNLTPEDNVHTAGCKVILSTAKVVEKLVKSIGNGNVPKAVKQWKCTPSRYYGKADFNEEILQKYYKNLENGMVSQYCQAPQAIDGLLSHED